jgi:hydroxymethylpyrimidine kinase/phosphomethylpyrimidine kinase
MLSILSIAGSDSSGGAGVQADLKTITALQLYGMTVITALTAQNTVGVQAVEGVSVQMVQQQLASIIDDINVDAIKTGMLYSTETIVALVETLAERYTLQDHPPFCLDPVCVSTSGHTLLPASAIDTLRSLLFPWATIITPNVPEAELLAGAEKGSIIDVNSMRHCAIQLSSLGCRWILIKGGHCQTSASKVVDLLWDSVEKKEFIYERERIETRNTHGTGCTLSAAIACYLAKGYPGTSWSTYSNFRQSHRPNLPVTSSSSGSAIGRRFCFRCHRFSIPTRKGPRPAQPSLFFPPSFPSSLHAHFSPSLHLLSDRVRPYCMECLRLSSLPARPSIRNSTPQGLPPIHQARLSLSIKLRSDS